MHILWSRLGKLQWIYWRFVLLNLEELVSGLIQWQAHLVLPLVGYLIRRVLVIIKNENISESIIEVSCVVVHHKLHQILKKSTKKWDLRLYQNNCEENILKIF